MNRRIKGIVGMMIWMLGALCYIVTLAYSLAPLRFGTISKFQCVCQCVIGIAIGACLIYWGGLMMFDADVKE